MNHFLCLILLFTVLCRVGGLEPQPSSWKDKNKTKGSGSAGSETCTVEPEVFWVYLEILGAAPVAVESTGWCGSHADLGSNPTSVTFWSETLDKLFNFSGVFSLVEGEGNRLTSFIPCEDLWDNMGTVLCIRTISHLLYSDHMR